MTTTKPAERDGVAPDGLDVRVLVQCNAGSMAHFELAPNEVSVAVSHRTLDEMWYFIGGEGELWRRSERDSEEKTVPVSAGVAVTIPKHTHFQLRSTGGEPLAAVGATLPPWPGIGEMDGSGEIVLVDGPWVATVPSGMRAE